MIDVVAWLPNDTRAALTFNVTRMAGHPDRVVANITREEITSAGESTWTAEWRNLLTWVVMLRACTATHGHVAYKDRAKAATKATIHRWADDTDGAVGVRLLHLIYALTLPGGPYSTRADAMRHAGVDLGVSQDTIRRRTAAGLDHMTGVDVVISTVVAEDELVRRLTSVALTQGVDLEPEQLRRVLRLSRPA